MKTTTNLDKENATGENQLGPDANYPVRILTATSIIEAMTIEEVPKEIRLLLADLGRFACSNVAVTDSGA